MTNSPIQQFYNHPYRHWMVGGATALLGFVICLPAYDKFSGVRSEIAELEEQIDEVTRSVSNIEPLRQRVAEAEALSSNGQETVDKETAMKLREDVVRLIHDHHCRLLQCQLTDPNIAPFDKDTDPFAKRSSGDVKKAKFQLVKTKMNLSAEGTLKQISQLVDEIAVLHAMAVPTRMVLEQEGADEQVKIEIELTLLDLTKNTG